MNLFHGARVVKGNLLLMKSKILIKKLYGGDDSDVFLFNIDPHKYVFKIYTKFILKDVLAEIKAMNLLAKRFFPTPRPIKFKNGRQYFLCDDKPMIVYPYLEGRIAGKFKITSRIVREIGSLAAKIDLSLKRADIKSIRKKKTYWDLLQFGDLAPMLNILPGRYKKLITSIEKIFYEYRLIEKNLKKLPRQLILNDISETNVLIKNGRVSGLVDFSDMVYSPRVCNLAIMAAHLCFDDRNWKAKTKSLVRAYQGYYPIPRKHLKFLPTLIRARVATLVIGNCYQQKTEKGKKYFSVINKNAKRLNFLGTINDDSILSGL